MLARLHIRTISTARRACFLNVAFLMQDLEFCNYDERCRQFQRIQTKSAKMDAHS